MIVITELIGDVVKRVSDSLDTNVNYQFGDWDYISHQLMEYSKSEEWEAKKYPVICLFSPFDEVKVNKRYHCEVKLDFLIAVNTISEYTNEERSEYSFKEVLRPIYNSFIKELKKDIRFDVYGEIPHIYSENYRYGSRGVMQSDGKKFNDLIDGIDIKELELKVNKEKCYEKL